MREAASRGELEILCDFCLIPTRPTGGLLKGAFMGFALPFLFNLRGQSGRIRAHLACFRVEDEFLALLQAPTPQLNGSLLRKLQEWRESDMEKSGRG